MVKKLKNKYLQLPVQVKASVWFLFASFFQKGIAVITTPIFTRVMTTAEYGQYNVFYTWLQIIAIVVTMQLYSGMYAQGLAKYTNDKAVFTSSLQGLVLVMVLVGLAIYLCLADFWNGLLGLTTVQMLAMFVMIWGSAVFSFWSMEQRSNMKYKKLIILTLLVSTAQPIVGVISVITATDKVTARIVSMAMISAIAYSFLFLVHMKKGKVFYAKHYWKHAIVFCFPLIPHYLSLTILNSMDRIMIAKMVGASEVGIYSLAYSVALIMTILNGAFLSTLEPWLFQKIRNGQVNDLASVAYPSLVIIAAMNLIVIAFAPEVIAFFAPAEYVDAIWIVPPVAMSSFFTFAFMLFAVFQFHFEKTKSIAVATAIGAMLNIGLNYICIELFGYYAAGYTTLVCYIAFAIAHYCLMRKLCTQYLQGQQPYRLKILLLITSGFMTLGFLYLITYQWVVLRYALTGFIVLVLIWKRTVIITNIKRLLSMKKEN